MKTRLALAALLTVISAPAFASMMEVARCTSLTPEQLTEKSDAIVDATPGKMSCTCESNRVSCVQTLTVNAVNKGKVKEGETIKLQSGYQMYTPCSSSAVTPQDATDTQPRLLNLKLLSSGAYQEVKTQSCTN